MPSSGMRIESVAAAAAEMKICIHYYSSSTPNIHTLSPSSQTMVAAADLKVLNILSYVVVVFFVRFFFFRSVNVERKKSFRGNGH